MIRCASTRRFELSRLTQYSRRTRGTLAHRWGNGARHLLPVAGIPACYDPVDPTWLNRDRFVLSNGHASMLLYAMLYLAGGPPRG